MGAARHYVIERLAEHGVDRWPADLLVTELATNVIVHAGSEFEVVVHVDGVVRVTVVDDSLTLPSRREAADYAMSGRGLQIIDQLATRWGVEPRRDGDGKVVWFELPSED